MAMVTPTAETSPNLEIRSAVPTDAQTIAEFNRRLAYESEGLELDPQTVAKGVAAVMADATKGRYFIAEGNGAAVGQTLVTLEWSDWRNGYWWWIQSVYVDQSWRRRGVFRALYCHIEQEARNTPGVIGLRLYVEHENETAQTAYLNIGMLRTSYHFFEAPFD